jgi:hypothetical protein
MVKSWGMALRLAAVAALSLALLALAACEEPAGAEPTAVVGSVPTSEAAPEPTATPVPEPTPTATPESEPTPTAAPEAASTPGLSADLEEAMQAVMTGPCGEIFAYAQEHPELLGEGGTLDKQAVAGLRGLAERAAADPQLQPLADFLLAVADAQGDVAVVPEDVVAAATTTLMETCNFGALMDALVPEVERMFGEMVGGGPLAQACLRLAFVGLQAPREAFTDEAKWQEYSSYRDLMGTPLGVLDAEQFWQELSAVYDSWSGAGGDPELAGLLVAAYAARSFDGYKEITEASEMACEKVFAESEALGGLSEGLEEGLEGFKESLEESGLGMEDVGEALEAQINTAITSFTGPLLAKVSAGQFANPTEEGCLRVTAAMLIAPEEAYSDPELREGVRAFRSMVLGDTPPPTVDEFWAEMERGRAALDGQPGTEALVAALADAIAARDLDAARTDAIGAAMELVCSQYVIPLMAP